MIPIYKPYIYNDAKTLAMEAISQGYIANGPHIEKFEKDFAQLCNRQFGVSCCNGTVALHLAIKALNIPHRAEVILPSMTIVSCLTAVLENNLTPVFCDINPITYNVDFDSIEDKITPNTKAVIVVDTYGLVVDVDRLRSFKKKHPNIIIIEDASEAHGASYKKTVAGSIGDISTFSFYSNKIVTTGEGGMVLTDSKEISDRLQAHRNLNFVDRKKYIHSEAGFNYRITNIQCAIGLGQLANMQETIKQRKRVAYEYNSRFKQSKHIQLPFEDSDYNNVYWYYAIVLKKNYSEVLKALESNLIDYRHFFHPLHQQPFMNRSEHIKYSQQCFENGILLPIFNELTSEEINFIADTILAVL